MHIIPTGKIMVLRKHVRGRPFEPCATEGVLVRITSPVEPSSEHAFIHAKRGRDKFTDFGVTGFGSNLKLICKADWLCKPELFEVSTYTADVFLGYPHPKGRHLALSWECETMGIATGSPKVLRSGHLLTIELDTSKRSYMRDRDSIPLMAICGVPQVDTSTNTYEVRVRPAHSVLVTFLSQWFFIADWFRMADVVMQTPNEPHTWAAEVHPRLFRAKCGPELWNEMSRLKCDLSLDAEIDNLNPRELASHQELRSILVDYIGNYFWLKSIPPSKLGLPWEDLVPEWDSYYTENKSTSHAEAQDESPRAPKAKKRVLEDDEASHPSTKRKRGSREPSPSPTKSATAQKQPSKTPAKPISKGRRPASPQAPPVDDDRLLNVTLERNALKKELNSAKNELNDLRRTLKHKSKELDEAQTDASRVQSELETLQAHLRDTEARAAQASRAAQAEAVQALQASEASARAALIRAEAAEGELAAIRPRVSEADASVGACHQLKELLDKKDKEFYHLYQRLGEAEKSSAFSSSLQESDKYKVSLLESQISQLQAQAERDISIKLREGREDLSKVSSTLEQRLAVLENRLSTKLDHLGTVTINALIKTSTAPPQTQALPYAMPPGYAPHYFGYGGMPPAPVTSPGPGSDDALQKAMQEFLQRRDQQ